MRIGVDIGGTFTDLVLIDENSGTVRLGKLLTTPDNPTRAVMDGIARLLHDAGVAARVVRALVHGTTLVTNAIIERKGAKTALITTRGFRDTLEIAREGRYDMYDLFIDPPEPLVPRRMRFEVGERVQHDGTVLIALEDHEAMRAIGEAVGSGARAIAVTLLHAHINPLHEQRMAALLGDLAPDVAVSCSSEVAPEIREYERTSTTVANAYVMPLMGNYLAELEKEICAVGIPGRFFVMLSSGGIASAETARRFPVRLVESGPAAGAVAAARWARLGGERRVLSFDMGGTTAKACIIENGEPLIAHQSEIARAARFKKGSGIPIQAPTIELIEIGAGGGSIGWIDNMGLLKVGPRSSGANPGPACYGLGASEPTVTDADLLLGYLDPDFFLGGAMRLEAGAARRAIEQRIARPLQLDVIEAAWGIHRVVDENMAAAAGIHGIERGKDLRSCAMFVFGGAGPMHCWEVARALRVRRILIPFGAGALSAMGLLAAPLAFDFVRTACERLDNADWARVNALYDGMEAEGRAILASAGVGAGQVTLRRNAEMRYVGQGHEVEVRVPLGRLSAASVPELMESFDQAYRALYHVSVSTGAVEALNWRLRVSAPAPEVRITRKGEDLRDTTARSGQAVGDPLKGKRRAYFAQARGFVETPVYDRYRLRPDIGFEGPAIIEERESTTIIGPGGRCRVDDDLTLVVDMPEARAS